MAHLHRALAAAREVAQPTSLVILVHLARPDHVHGAEDQRERAQQDIGHDLTRACEVDRRRAGRLPSPPPFPGAPQPSTLPPPGCRAWHAPRPPTPGRWPA